LTLIPGDRFIEEYAVNEKYAGLTQQQIEALTAIDQDLAAAAVTVKPGAIEHNCNIVNVSEAPRIAAVAPVTATRNLLLLSVPVGIFLVFIVSIVALFMKYEELSTPTLLIGTGVMVVTAAYLCVKAIMERGYLRRRYLDWQRRLLGRSEW